MGVPSFYKWVKERYPLIAGRVHQTCSDSPDGQAGAGPVDNLCAIAPRCSALGILPCAPVSPIFSVLPRPCASVTST